MILRMTVYTYRIKVKVDFFIEELSSAQRGNCTRLDVFAQIIIHDDITSWHVHLYDYHPSSFPQVRPQPTAMKFKLDAQVPTHE